MDIKKFVCGDYESNAYMVSSAGEALVIDPGEGCEEIVTALKATGHHLRYILLTHGHFDHVLGVLTLKEIFPDANIIIGENDQELLNNLSKQGEYINRKLPDFNYEALGVAEGSAIPFGDELITVIETPGHTKGSVCYQLDGKLFTGDTLFYHTYGRIDLPYSAPEQMKESLMRLFELDEELEVLPGHSQATTIKEEKAFFGL